MNELLSTLYKIREHCAIMHSVVLATINPLIRLNLFGCAGDLGYDYARAGRRGPGNRANSTSYPLGQVERILVYRLVCACVSVSTRDTA